MAGYFLVQSIQRFTELMQNLVGLFGGSEWERDPSLPPARRMGCSFSARRMATFTVLMAAMVEKSGGTKLIIR